VILRHYRDRPGRILRLNPESIILPENSLYTLIEGILCCITAIFERKRRYFG